MSELTLQSTVKLTSGYEVPVLGLGLYKNDVAEPSCIAALQHGYRHIDSARFYENEAEAGRALRASGLKREDVFVTSKVYNDQTTYTDARTAVQSSLDKFGFEYLDLYLIHSPLEGKKNRLETWRGLVELQKEGKLRTIGVSNYGPKHLEEIREAGLPQPAVNQIELHPFCQQRPIVEYCKKAGIIVQAYSPLVQGNRLDDPVFLELAKKYNKDVAQILIRWSLQKGFVVLAKSSKPARIASNASVFDFTLSAEDIAQLDALDEGKKGAVTWNPVDAE